MDRRAMERCGAWTRRAIALLLLCPFLSCRDSGDPAGAAEQETFILLRGDRFAYDVWTTNTRGVPLDTSLTRTEWEVLSSDPGGSGLVEILRTRTPLPPRPEVRDTFLLRCGADGLIQWRGFLAEIIGRREGRTIPVRWDTLAELRGSAWRVGALDSAGEENLTGVFATTPNYVSVSIDGTPVVLPARRIELTAPSLEIDLWISTSPSCLPLWEEYPDPYLGITQGSRAILREAMLAPGPRPLSYLSRLSQSLTW